MFGTFHCLSVSVIERLQLSQAIANGTVLRQYGKIFEGRSSQYALVADSWSAGVSVASGVCEPKTSGMASR